MYSYKIWAFFKASAVWVLSQILMVLIFSSLLGAPNSSAEDDTEFNKKFDRLKKCVHSQFQSRSSDPLFADYIERTGPIGKGELPVDLEFILLSLIKKSDIKKWKESNEEKEFCDFSVKTIIKAASEKIPVDADLAPTGTLLAQTGNFFINIGLVFYHIAEGRHLLGHSDITEIAIAELERKGADFKFNSEAKNLLIKGSQASDQYAWDIGSAHAHTPEQGLETKRDTVIAQAKKDFYKFICMHYRKLKENLTYPVRPDMALVHLGIIVHGIQDLLYHKGMTMEQHSGLSYFLNKNPDLLPGNEIPDYHLNPEGEGTEARVAFDKAKNLTKEIILLIKKLEGPANWNIMRKWKHESNFADLAYDAFGLEPGAVEYGKGLITYKNMAQLYAKGIKKENELIAPINGGTRVVWEIDEVYSNLVLEVEKIK